MIRVSGRRLTLGLEIAVDDVLPVQVVERARGLQRDAHQHDRVELVLVHVQAPVERRPGAPLGDDRDLPGARARRRWLLLLDRQQRRRRRAAPAGAAHSRQRARAGALCRPRGDAQEIENIVVSQLPEKRRLQQCTYSVTRAVILICPKVYVRTRLQSMFPCPSHF